MTVASIGRFIQDLSVFAAVRESMYVYPIVLSTHLACIATFGGLILITDLRLLGWTLTDIPIDDMIRSLRPWKQLGERQDVRDLGQAVGPLVHVQEIGRRIVHGGRWSNFRRWRCAFRAEV
jgi:hypothetical protein